MVGSGWAELGRTAAADSCVAGGAPAWVLPADGRRAMVCLTIPNDSLSYPQQVCQFLVVVWCTFHVLNWGCMDVSLINPLIIPLIIPLINTMIIPLIIP